MKGQWKQNRNVMFTVLIVFILLIFMIGLGFLLDGAEYPEPVYGLSRMRAFCMVTAFVTCIAAIPLLADITLLVISIIKIDRRQILTVL